MPPKKSFLIPWHYCNGFTRFELYSAHSYHQERLARGLLHTVGFMKAYFARSVPVAAPIARVLYLRLHYCKLSNTWLDCRPLFDRESSKVRFYFPSRLSQQSWLQQSSLISCRLEETNQMSTGKYKSSSWFENVHLEIAHHHVYAAQPRWVVQHAHADQVVTDPPSKDLCRIG